jgi:hypothetical protein
VAEEQYKNKVDGAVGTSGQKKWPYCVFVLIGILLALFGQGLRKELSLPSASLSICVCVCVQGNRGEERKKADFCSPPGPSQRQAVGKSFSEDFHHHHIGIFYRW